LYVGSKTQTVEIKGRRSDINVTMVDN